MRCVTVFVLVVAYSLCVVLANGVSGVIRIKMVDVAEPDDIDDLGDNLCYHCPEGENCNTNQYNMCEGRWCDLAYDYYLDSLEIEASEEEENAMQVKKVIFNNPVTVVIWSDGTKTIVRASSNDTFTKEAGFLTAYFQKTSGMTKSQYRKFFNKIKSDSNENN